MTKFKYQLISFCSTISNVIIDKRCKFKSCWKHSLFPFLLVCLKVVEFKKKKKKKKKISKALLDRLLRMECWFKS